MALDENNLAISPISSALSPLELLLKDVFASASKNHWKNALPSPNKIQHIKQLIIKLHTCKRYADPTRIWEIDDDCYLIRIDDNYPTVYVTKCTLQQAIHFETSQIPFFPHITSSMADLDKDTLRIASVFTRFPEVAPFIFEVQMDVTANTISSRRAHTFQKRIVNIFLTQAPLVPKSTRLELQTYYTSLGDQNADNANASPEVLVKVYIFIYVFQIFMFISLTYDFFTSTFCKIKVEKHFFTFFLQILFNIHIKKRLF